MESAIKNGTKETFAFLSNVVRFSNDENNFPHKLLLTNTQVSKLRKAFTSNSLANIKLSKTHLYIIVQPGGFLGRILGPLLKAGLPLIRNVLKSSAKSVLIPLGYMAAESATGADIHKKTFGYGFTTLIISNEEMNDIKKLVKSLVKSGLLIKGISKAIKNEAKSKQEDF